MSLKIIKKGVHAGNIRDHYDFPVIDWRSIEDDREARAKALKQPKGDDGQVGAQDHPVEQKVESHSPVDEKPAVDIEFLREQGEKILQEAQNKKDIIEREAFDKGHQTGLEMGREEGKAEYIRVLSRLAESIESLAHVREEAVSKYQPEILKLAVRIAEKILRREIQMGSDHIFEILNQLISSMKDKSVIRVMLSPEDYTELKDNPKLTEFKYVSSDFSVEEDPSLKKGDVMVGTSFGTIDASIESQIKKIKEELVPDDEV